jgi:hypothetical protein
MFRRIIFSGLYIYINMGAFGAAIGNLLGTLGSKIMPIDGVDGGKLGSFMGNLAPFKTGGKVPGKKGRPKVIMAHGGEYVLPANVKPTKAQKAIVARNKAAAKRRK